MLQKIKEQWAIFVLVCIIPIIHISFGTENSYIADSALKAMQTDSLIQNGFQSEVIRYPAESLDPMREAFFLPGFAKEIRGRFIGQYPIGFTFLSSILRLTGVSWKWMPLCSSLCMVFALFFLSRKKIIGQRTVILGFWATILFALSLDFSEYSIYFLFNSIGFSYWLNYRSNKEIKELYFALFFCSIPVWLRLESIIFLASLIIAEGLFSFKDRQTIFRKLNLIGILLGISPLILFFIWNFYDYGHILGVRFMFNYGHDSSDLLGKVSRFFSITFFNYVSGIPKFGLFFCSPFLLVPIIYYIFSKYPKDEKITFLLFVIGLNIILVGTLAPNDGITITGRYVVLTIIPLLALWELWMPQKTWKIISISLIVLSFLISGVILKILQHSVKQERIYRNYYSQDDSSLWIFTDPLLCGQAGIDHLSRKILCINRETNVERIISNVKKDKSIESVAVFEMNSELNFLGTETTALLQKERIKLKFDFLKQFGHEVAQSDFKGVKMTRFQRTRD
ncbi:LA_3751/LA_3752 family putative glycosyltransferase [Leptospira yasudae]|uniref:LA_3751/LA_3752 family putative glycosyltransferase n=1 Tax=Leptospira yasudae TaxID=2202201 RepID=UPI001F4DA35D|nr:hypothetical protein [Leptospira yasudae]